MEFLEIERVCRRVTLSLCRHWINECVIHIFVFDFSRGKNIKWRYPDDFLLRDWHAILYALHTFYVILFLMGRIILWRQDARFKRIVCISIYTTYKTMSLSYKVMYALFFFYVPNWISKKYTYTSFHSLNW